MSGREDRSRSPTKAVRPTALRMAGTSIVLTSHSLEECEVLCSRVGIVRSGRLAAIGSPTELRARLGGYVIVCQGPRAAEAASALVGAGLADGARSRERRPLSGESKDAR